MKERKPVWYPPVFDKLSTGKSADVQLVFNQLRVANFVRDSKVALGKATLDDRLEEFEICRHSHHSISCVGDGDRDTRCDDTK